MSKPELVREVILDSVLRKQLDMTTSAIGKIKKAEGIASSRDIVKADKLLNSIATLKPPTLDESLVDIFHSMPSGVAAKNSGNG